VCVWYNDIGPSAHVSIIHGCALWLRRIIHVRLGSADVSAVHDVFHFALVVLPVVVVVVVVCHDRIIPSSRLFVKLNRKVFLLAPRMPSCIPYADHGEWDKDCCQHCDCCDVHCVLPFVPCCFVCYHYIYIIVICQPLSPPKILFSQSSYKSLLPKELRHAKPGFRFFTNVRARVYCRAIAGSRLCTSTHARVGRLVYPHLLGLFTPRMPFGISHANHDDRQKDGGEHCSGDECVCHACIVPEERLFVKCRSGIVASYQRCLLSPIACLVQATSGGFVKDDGDCDNEKGIHSVCFLVVVVVVSYTCIILILSSIVKATHHLFLNFPKVVVSRYRISTYDVRNPGFARLLSSLNLPNRHIAGIQERHVEVIALHHYGSLRPAQQRQQSSRFAEHPFAPSVQRGVEPESVAVFVAACPNLLFFVCHDCIVPSRLFVK